MALTIRAYESLFFLYVLGIPLIYFSGIRHINVISDLVIPWTVILPVICTTWCFSRIR